MSYDSNGVDDELFTSEDSTGYIPNHINIYILNFVTIILLIYSTLIHFANREALHLLFELSWIGIFQSVLILVLFVTLYFNTKVLLILDPSWKIVAASSVGSLMLSFIHVLILLQNPTAFNYSELLPDNVLISPNFWMVFFYPLLMIFYLAPVIAWIELNESYERNMKISLLSFLGSIGLFLLVEGSKIWNLTGWTVFMISFNLGIVDVNGVNFVSSVSGFNISNLGLSLILTSMLLLALGCWFLYTEIKFQPNSFYTIIPYAVVAFVLTIDSLFSKMPADIKLLNTGLIIGWILIIVLFTIGYALIPNSFLNSRITGEVSFKPMIMSRMSERKLETQILDTIEENEIRKIIEISSFLSVPYHKVLKCLKNLIVQGYLQGRIVKQQFVKVNELSNFETGNQMTEFPSPFEIWKLTMINEGVISIDNLATIMSINSKDLEQLFLSNNENESNFGNYIDGYVYINKIEDLDELDMKIKKGLVSLSELKDAENSKSLRTNDAHLSDES